MKNVFFLFAFIIGSCLIACTNDGSNDNPSGNSQADTSKTVDAEVYKSRITYEDLTFLPDLDKDVRGGVLRAKDEDYYTLNLDGEKTFSFYLDAPKNNYGVRVIGENGEMIKSEINKNGRIVHVFDKSKTGVHRVVVHLERNTRLKDVPVEYDIVFTRE